VIHRRRRHTRCVFEDDYLRQIELLARAVVAAADEPAPGDAEVPSGAAPQPAAPRGAGAAPDATAPDGPVRGGGVQADAAPDATLPDGPVRGGGVQAGAAPDAAAPVGPVREGEVEAGGTVESVARRDADARAAGTPGPSAPGRPAGDAVLRAAIGELARALRYQHFVGDGCVDDRPIRRLGGAAVITPAQGDSFRDGCARLGVAERAAGWGIWYAWDDRGRPHMLVVTAVETTRALLENWSQGRDVHPAEPLRAQVAAVARGWAGPMVLAPGYAARAELGGH
jgi:hypothetical protein